MQIFLPYRSFEQTARCLDTIRLGKQRLEARQIISLLEQYDNGVDISVLPWGNHPVVNMWKGYTDEVLLYYNYMLSEWERRGYENNMEFGFCYRPHLEMRPVWYDNNDIFRAYRSKLLLKGECDALIKNINTKFGLKYIQWALQFDLPKQKHELKFGHLPILYDLNDDKDYINWYVKFNWDVPLDLEYKWE